MAPIRVAIIGAGIGAAHLDACRQLPDRYTVAWLCDLDIAKAQAIAGDVPVTGSLDEVLADPTVDVIDICLPPPLHAPVTLQSFAAGKHVICEKPPALSLPEMDAIAATAAAAGRQYFPVFQYRNCLGVAQARALVDSGAAGKPLAAAVTVHWDRRADYYAVPWRGRWSGEGGGCTLTHAIHHLDILTLLMGPATAVQASLATRVNAIETEDCAALAIELGDGAVAAVSVTLGTAHERSRFHLCFEHATIDNGIGDQPYLAATAGWDLVARGDKATAAVAEATALPAPSHAGHAGLLTEIAAALAGEPSQAPGLDDARRAVELAAAIYAAARSGAKIHLPLAKTDQAYGPWAPAGA